MKQPTGSSMAGPQSGEPMIGIVNQPLPEYIKPIAVETGQPVIEITCSICGELTSRTYPIEINGEMVATAPNEKYSCSCPSPS